MMTLPTRFDNELSSESGKNSPALKALVVTGTDGSSRLLYRPESLPRASSKPCPIFQVETLVKEDGDRPSFDAFSSLLSDLEANQATAKELSEARKWVADSFYEGSPTLVSLRLSAGLSQKQLGEACEIEQPHVSRYESGKHEPGIGLSAKMATALGVDLDTFACAWRNTRKLLNTEGEKS